MKVLPPGKLIRNQSNDVRRGINDGPQPYARGGTGPPRLREGGSGLTSYAVVKYGFILVITIVVLYFVARYLLPLIGD
ncbi:MAG TPA: hypothetical protein VFH75_08345 [Actinomycetota bacterium]|nr:hypothetical protein [Actinomycetota bacterium]